MNKMGITTLVAAAALAAGAAQAQQVTIYGRLNLTLERQKTDAGSLTVLANNSSRWGLKGSEDLGGGMKAGFQLESGFDASNGAANATFWGRQSELNLGGEFGKLRLGRYTSEAYFATADYVSNHNHDTGSSSDRLYAYIGSDSNKIAYRAPELAKGWTAEAAVALKETDTDNTYDVAVNGSVGDLALGLGWQKYGNAKQLAVRAFYTVGAFGFGGYVQHDTDAFSIAGSRTNLRLSGMYTLGASEFHVNVGKAGKIGGVGGSEGRQYTLAYNYNLSKRTKVYAYYTDGQDGSLKVYGGDASSVAFGLRHNF